MYEYSYFLKEKINILVVDWNEIEGTKFTVDASYQLGDLMFQLGGVGKRRGGNLNQNNVSSPLRVIT